MALDDLQVAPEGAGPKVDGRSFERPALSGNLIKQQTVSIGDGEDDHTVETATANPAGGARGFVTRNIPALALMAADQATESGVQDVVSGLVDVVTTLTTLLARLPAVLAAGGGFKVEGVAGGTAVPVQAAALPLPANAATETTLAAASGKLPAALVGGRLDVNVGASALPAGAATQATLAQILTALGATLDVDASGSAVTISGTVPMTAAQLPAALIGGRLSVDVGASALPAGAATDAKLAGGLPAALGVGGGLKVDGSGTPLPVSGTVTITDGSGPVTVDGTVTVGTQPVRTRTADAIAAALQTDAVMNGATALTPKWAAVTLAADGALVALVAAKKIRLLSAFLNNAGAADGTLAVKSNNAAGTTLIGATLLRIGGGYVLPFNPTGWCETAAGEALFADLTSITALAGVVEYVEV